MRRNLTKGALWLGATRAMVSLIGFASTIVLARLLTPADFGIIAMTTSVLALVTSLTELSMAGALIHHAAPEPDHFHTAWTLNFARSTLILLAFAVMSPFIAMFSNDARLIPVFLVTGLTGAMGGLGNPKTITLTKKLIFWQEFLIQVTQKLGGFLISIPIALLLHTYWALILGNFTSTVISVGVSYMVCPYFPRFTLSKHREMLNFSVWLAFVSVINTLNWRFDQLLLGFFLGKPQLGVYSVGANLSALPTREATFPIAQTLFPAFVSVRDDPERLRMVYQRAQATMCAVALPIGFGMAAIAHPLVLLLMGQKWIAVSSVIQVLAISFALDVLSSGLQPLAMADGDTKMLFQREARVFAIRLPAVLGGLWLAGLQGAVWGSAISSFISLLMNMALITRFSGVSVRSQFGANRRALISVVLMFGAISALKLAFPSDQTQSFLMLELFNMVALGGLVYVVTTYIFWRVAGSPNGPESELAIILSKFGLKSGN